MVHIRLHCFRWKGVILTSPLSCPTICSQGSSLVRTATSKNVQFLNSNIKIFNFSIQLMPLLIQSLSLSEPSLKTSTLTTLYSLVHDAPLVISQHISSLIPPLLLLSKQNQQMTVRIAALQCVGVLTILPHHVVFPYRMQVIRELASTLDDRKRLVRKEAVKCRGEWLRMKL
jgi:DNA repair/transcription protein MET18/MMS19